MECSRFKFRVWDGNRYIQYRPCIDQEPFVFDMTDVIGENYPKNLDGCTIEQCSGLRDKNGKLIYEGDVLRFSTQIDVCVTFRNGGFVYSLTEDETPAYRLSEVIAKSTEIIGNIHRTETKENT